ncbi:MAG: MoxR family ATPase [Planctomycetota bacterium]|nr:MoxR family ATPase [Planctomycetota bacterium]
MPITKCGECGRTYNLKPEQYGRVKCKCGSILNGPTPVEDASEESPLQQQLQGDLSDLEAVKVLKEAYESLREQIAQVIVGQEQVVEELLIAIFARGHCLLEGVPGLAKTLLVSTLAKALHLSFKRIQFTPDLMPTDITGTEVIQENKATGEREFRFIKGPIFANMILADEINRTPPKTQAALLEAMQEKSVTVGGTNYVLDKPFFVLATQNPLDQEGTYTLPEAQLDRFIFKIFVNYPSDDEELEIMKRVTTPSKVEIQPVLDAGQILKLQEIVLRVPVADHVYHYAKKIVRSTRPAMGEAPDFIKDWISWGAGPRASLNLILAGKARAILNGQFHVSCEDIAAVTPAVMRHRIACNFTAQAEGITTDKVVEKLIESIPMNQKLEGESSEAAD